MIGMQTVYQTGFGCVPKKKWATPPRVPGGLLRERSPRGTTAGLSFNPARITQCYGKMNGPLTMPIFFPFESFSTLGTLGVSSETGSLGDRQTRTTRNL